MGLIIESLKVVIILYIQKRFVNKVDFVRPKFEATKSSPDQLNLISHILKESSAFIKVKTLHSLTKELMDSSEGEGDVLHIGFIDEKCCDTYVDLFRKYSRNPVWLLVGNFNITSVSNMLKLPLNNMVTLLTWDMKYNFRFYESYQVSVDTKVHIEEVAKWHLRADRRRKNNLSNSFLFPSEEPWSRRTLSGVTLRCGVALSPGSVISSVNKNASHHFTGETIKLFDDIKKALNFTSICRLSKDKQFGDLLPSGQWTGLIKELTDGSIDIAAAPLDTTYNRGMAVTFLHEYKVIDYVVIIKTAQNNMWTNFTRELTHTAWILLAFVFCIFLLLLRWFSRLHPKEGDVSTGNAFFILITSFLAQECRYRPATCSLRILLNTWLLLSLVTYTYYTTFLTSSLTINHSIPPFTDLRGIYKQRRSYSIGCGIGSAVNIHLKASPDPVIRKLYYEMILRHPKNHFRSRKKGINEVVSRSAFAFIVSSVHEDNTRCDITTLPTRYFKSPIAMAIRKNSSYFHLLNYHMKRAIQNGIYDRHRSFYKKKNPSKNCLKKFLHQVSFTDIASMLVVLMVSTMLSFVFLLLEIVKSKIRLE